MLSHIRSRLRSEVAGIPFSFPPAGEILEEDGLFFSRLLSGFSAGFDLPAEKITRMAVVFELVRTTLEVHSRVSREKKIQERFFENDKLAILAGDDLFTRALAEIPELNAVELQKEVHRRIREACRHRLLLSLGEKIWAAPLLLSVLLSPYFAVGKRPRDLKLLGRVSVEYAKNHFASPLPAGEISWLTRIRAQKMHPETERTLEIFQKELQRPLPLAPAD